MKTMRCDPFGGLEDLSNRRNALPGRSDLASCAPNEALDISDWSPPVDIAEMHDEYVVKVECPSAERGDFKVVIEQGHLRISGQLKQATVNEGEKPPRAQPWHGSFLRIFALPDNVDDTTVTAEFEEGVLRVHLRKSDISRHRTMDIKVS
jgi:HSP20 family protein